MLLCRLTDRSVGVQVEYSKVVGREARVDEIQPMVNQMISANVLMRRGHGQYEPTDAFAQQIWSQRYPKGLHGQDKD